MNNKDREKLIEEIKDSFDVVLIACNASLKTTLNIDDEAMNQLIEILKLDELTRIRQAIEKISEK